MDLDELIDGLEALIEQQETEIPDDPGERNFRCVDCRACYDCRFCVRCTSSQECTYCEECWECTGCTQCRRCVGCEGSSYCEDSRDCQSSRYLTLCVDCEDCVHCLACVGLTGAEFHVLNEELPRREYFELLKKVQAELESRSARGWRPETIGLEPYEEVTNVYGEGEDAVDDDESPWMEDGSDPGPDDSAWAPQEAPPARSSLSRGGRPTRPLPSDQPVASSERERTGTGTGSGGASGSYGKPAKPAPRKPADDADEKPKEGLRRGRRPPRR